MCALTAPFAWPRWGSKSPVRDKRLKYPFGLRQAIDSRRSSKIRPAVFASYSAPYGWCRDHRPNKHLAAVSAGFAIWPGAAGKAELLRRKDRPIMGPHHAIKRLGATNWARKSGEAKPKASDIILRAKRVDLGFNRGTDILVIKRQRLMAILQKCRADRQCCQQSEDAYISQADAPAPHLFLRPFLRRALCRRTGGFVHKPASFTSSGREPAASCVVNTTLTVL